MSKNALSTIIAYHEASKHRLDGYAPGPGGLDWANQPDPFRRYAGTQLCELPLRPLRCRFRLARSAAAGGKHWQRSIWPIWRRCWN